MMGMHRITTASAMLVLSALVVGRTAEAQGRSAARNRPEEPAANRTRGLYVGVGTVNAQGIKITGEDIDGSFETKGGNGAGLTVGYALSPRLVAFASVDVAKQNPGENLEYQGTFGLTHFEVGARAYLTPLSSTMVPYLVGSVGRRAITARVHDINEDTRFNLGLYGSMIGVGGGVEYAMSSSTSLDAGLSIGTGRFGQFEADGDRQPIQVNSSTSIRIRASVNWRP